MSIIEADAVRRKNRLAEIQDGLKGAERWYWIDEARTRLAALREDEPIFGLVPHERNEANALERMLRTVDG